jgi:hypothetical protein
MAVSVSWRDPPSPEGADMFVPPVTEAHTEAAANTTSKPATSQPAHIARPCGGGAFKDAPTLRPSLGNQTMLRRLVRPATNVISYERGGNSRQYAEPAHLTAEATRPDIGWRFSKVPTFSPDRATRSNHVSPYAAARTAEAVVPLLDVGAVSVPAVHVEGPHEDEERPAPAPENATEAAAAPPATPTPPEVAKEAVPQIAVVPAQPKPMSLEAVQALAQQPGVPISGPPAGDTLAHVWSAGHPRDAGFTGWPAGYRAPDFDFNTTSNAKALPEAPEWYSQPRARTAAFEGSSASYYIAAGKYNTGLQESGKNVYWNFSPTISSLIKTGEQEHCNDFAESYRISLKEADTVMNSFIVGKNFGPKSAKADAEHMVLSEITARLTHPQLGNDKSQWAAKYSMLYGKTKTRDTRGWHTISLAARTDDATGVTYEVVQGTSTIPGPASNTIITY